MPERDRDSSDDLAGLLAGLTLALIGLVIGLVIAAWNKQKNVIRLPETLEPVEPQPPVVPPAQQKSQTGGVVATIAAWRIFQPDNREAVVIISTMYVFLLILVGVAAANIGGQTGIVLLGIFLFLCGCAPLVVFLTEMVFRSGESSRARAQLPPLAPDPLDLTTARCYTIRLPIGTDWQPELAYRFMEQILHRFDRLTFQIVAEKGRIVWQIADLRLELEPSLIVQAVHASYPDAEVEVGQLDAGQLDTPFYRYVLCFKQAADFVAPIRYVTDLKDFDPLVAIAQEMSGLGAGEKITYTLFVSGFADFAYKEGEKLVTTSAIHPLQFISVQGWVDAGVKAATKQDKLEKYQPADQKILREKLANPLYQVLLLVEASAPTKERLGELLVGFDSSIWQLANQPYNALVWDADHAPDAILCVETEETDWKTSTFGLLNAWLTNTNKQWKNVRLILEPRELASLWHLPYKGFGAAEILWASSRRAPAPAALAANTEGVRIGHNVYAGRRTPIYLASADRDSHMNIVGKTKVGKSTLMHALIHQDIAAGHGVAVIDPHGKLVSDVLRCSIPESRIDDVVVLDIANEEYPPPLNPLAIPKGTDHRIAAGRLMAILDKVYEGLAGTRIADTLTGALMTLWQEATPTVRDVARLFGDPDFRYRLLSTLDNIEAEEFWEKFEKQSPGQQEQLSYPVVYRMRTFYGNRCLYPMMCHPDALDFVRLIAEGKIILVSLRVDEDKIPPREQQLIGAVLVSQLEMAAIKSPKQKPPFYLYIDEAQNFVTTALPEVLTGARKFGLYLITANQYLRQLAGPTLDALMGNVGTSIIYQVGPDDARFLAGYLRPEFSADDLMNLALHEAAVKTRFEGQTLPAFSLESPEPLEEPANADAHEAYLRQRSVKLYTPRTHQEVLDWLRQRYPRPTFGSKVKRGGAEDDLPAFEPLDEPL